MNKRKQELRAICEKYNVIALYAFGSRALELLRVLENASFAFSPSASDLDIGVFTTLHLSAENKVNLTSDLENLFDAPRVDLFVLQEADAFLAANIVRGERVYTKDSYLADEYELFVLGRAGDLAELERERIATILQER
ncbi:MAG: nucleotidyltransferase domain-containing protein [Chloroflexota bacterium]